jgi:hypothetical protein
MFPWPLFVVIWIGLNLSAVAWLGRGSALALLAFPPVATQIVTGNLEILIGAAIVLGARWPAVWAFMLLTKVTPGIGLLWFAVRREWRSLFVALSVTVLVVIGTWIVLPQQWAEYASWLLSSRDQVNGWVPMWIRLPLAAGLVIWGARTNRTWTLVMAVVLAVPHFWFGSLAGMIAVAALNRNSDHRDDESRNAKRVQFTRVKEPVLVA